jgi:hypothetical protein
MFFLFECCDVCFDRYCVGGLSFVFLDVAGSVTGPHKSVVCVLLFELAGEVIEFALFFGEAFSDENCSVPLVFFNVGDLDVAEVVEFEVFCWSFLECVLELVGAKLDDDARWVFGVSVVFGFV